MLADQRTRDRSCGTIAVPLIANRGCGRRFGLDLAGGPIGQRRESRAVALIVGAGLAWTVSMISELSIPWR